MLDKYTNLNSNSIAFHLNHWILIWFMPLHTKEVNQHKACKSAPHFYITKPLCVLFCSTSPAESNQDPINEKILDARCAMGLPYPPSTCMKDMDYAISLELAPKIVLMISSRLSKIKCYLGWGPKAPRLGGRYPGYNKKKMVAWDRAVAVSDTLQVPFVQTARKTSAGPGKLLKR